MQRAVSPEIAIRRKYPEPVALVTTRAADGASNVMAVGWITVASEEPLMFVLGIDEAAHTLALIRQAGEFVVAFPSAAMARAALHAGSCHGQGRDKLAEAGLATQPAACVRAPLLAEAVANFECRRVAEYRPGDCPLVVGCVVAAHEHIEADVRRLYALAPGHVLGGVRPA